ncbi:MULTISPECIES: rRNA maturation RNase YbeY [unclassified Brevundimonas]|uniref:rRNA maturation RNase YbeY n=1 Tax=unclassified Brevundimonas TaxID=2622653 RepID=UPI000CFC00A8|nr:MULTISPECIES: rRNA maturation RNase YbeY [unclassified Brevundimonas]PRA36594.1 rRNA maturation RNase YbeY [Brevundimonas sp. MYb27]PQZ78443.1 rRNA maturation RNase YbeY [Brevundimonas sp. MYb31]PRB13546.1 rRNA maturation RNase YbeY [Brevundimonas sp. MYb52]PRB34238.1 rRNA maturation RNase YbeY [Brevundimonas sp. MYb46]PRB43553.1 rRNA maturation RNase YbeY [Brevundimonas sp. MYb33]
MIEIEVEDVAWSTAMPDAEAVVLRAATAALGTLEGDLVVLLTDDAEVQDLNKRFRDKDRPTNVLSFPAAESAFPHLGDVVLGYAYCAAEAEAQGKTLSDHLSHLVVHGVLHLLGRDHEDEAEAEEMEAEEREILAALGVADPYAVEHEANA